MRSVEEGKPVSDKQTRRPVRIGVLTSGGDAQGMNAAVRAVARSALKLGAVPYAIMDGWQGAVDGGDAIRELTWSSVSSILNKGGTVIGTARCAAFRERHGLLDACQHLVEKGIDRLVVIGGDGSLAGTNEFKEEWPSLLAELVEAGRITPAQAESHAFLGVAGLVGSIDNDLVGSDMTIGTDSAMDRILTAIDQLSSTAASHQRTFVVEVMGRHCGYLPLMTAVAGGCDYVFIPEKPPAAGWEDELADKLRAGRAAGRRESIVLVAEGAVDSQGQPITTDMVCDALEERMGERPHVTILGHVQRGGVPTAYDRWQPTVQGYCAVRQVLDQQAGDESVIVGVRHNRVALMPLMEAVRNTRAVKTYSDALDFDKAVQARGESFGQMLALNEIMSAPPKLEAAAPGAKRVAIMHVGGLAPGMNTATRTVVRLAIAQGHTTLGIEGSFRGLIDGKVRELGWEDVEGWGFSGGAELGTRRTIPTIEQFYAIGRSLENNEIDALVVIGGYNAYLSVQAMVAERDRYPAFNIPIIVVPASIDNNLPGSELSIGADSALNNAVWSLDRIKESAAASRRCFVADTMGRHCGYLALMAGLASGAEMVYLDEFPPSLEDIAAHARQMVRSFENDRRLFLVVRNEEAGGNYDREFVADVFAQEGQGLFDVRHAALGHLQQGGEPSAFDRVLATRLAARAVDELAEQFATDDSDARFIGLDHTGIVSYPFDDMKHMVDTQKRRPKNQWWLALAPLISAVSRDDDSVELPELKYFTSTNPVDNA
ncbi:6-phosphofructokinase [Nanchangia anserum]|uniref:6-phosphofructokinase n=1 Tax=Nanchangia anserum TaxID=2692125 RepID=A0A8I0KS82_9ACTO|nr:6-phosphofructokinase [Nanchangia anserum]MBD3690142.1 6-phosphofructokinase [Nanchangia anserum]